MEDAPHDRRGLRSLCACGLPRSTGTGSRSAARTPLDACLGDLAAGTYPSQFIRPRLPAGRRGPRTYGGVTYTVPDGWANSGDWPGEFSLVPSTDYASFGPDSGPDGVFNEIVVMRQPSVERAGRGLLAPRRTRPSRVPSRGSLTGSRPSRASSPRSRHRSRSVADPAQWRRRQGRARLDGNVLGPAGWHVDGTLPDGRRRDRRQDHLGHRRARSRCDVGGHRHRPG